MVNANPNQKVPTPLAVVLLGRLLLIMFGMELLLDIFLQTDIASGNTWNSNLVDATLLTLCSAPLVWVAVIRPLARLLPAGPALRFYGFFATIIASFFALEFSIMLALPTFIHSADNLVLQIADAFLVCLAAAPLFAWQLRCFVVAQDLAAEVGEIPTPLIIVYKLVFIIMLVEMLVMKALHWLRPTISFPTESVIDAAMVGLFVTPFIWLLVVRPVRTSAEVEKAQFETIVAEQSSALQQNEALLQNLTRQVPGLLYQLRMAPDGSFSLPYASEAMEDMFEISAVQMHDREGQFFARVHPLDLEPLLVSIRESATTLEPWQHEFRVVLPIKGVRWCQGNSRPERQDDGSIVWSGFLADITEMKRLEKELNDARRLEYIGQLAGGVAHEVRNPLNAILTLTEALFREEGVEGNDAFEPYIVHIRAQVNRLARLMNDLLDLGKPIPATSLQPVPLLDVCLETLALWQSTGMAENRKWVYDEGEPDMPVPLVRAESMRLQQVLFNLLENAGNHAPRGTEIRLRYVGIEWLGGEQSMVVMQVIDAGCGIPEDLLPRVFEPFYSSRRGGTGLGLALVKHFIDEMDGTVCIRNNSPDPGCTAEIRIPLARAEEAS